MCGCPRCDAGRGGAVNAGHGSGEQFAWRQNPKIGISPNPIRSHQTSSNIIKHHQTSSNIIQHHSTSFNPYMKLYIKLYMNHYKSRILHLAAVRFENHLESWNLSQRGRFALPIFHVAHRGLRAVLCSPPRGRGLVPLDGAVVDGDWGLSSEICSRLFNRSFG